MTGTGGRLAGKTVVVTGGGRGIGRAIVERFLGEGARVMTCGRGEPPDDYPAEVAFERIDVSSSAEVARLRDAARERLGKVDVLVNNAGAALEKKVTDSSDQDWDRLMGANAKGLFLCCRAFIPLMAAAGGGTIVNIGSISAFSADRSMALYNASKAFVHGLTRSIAGDHGGEGIRCNAIAPGWILTDMADSGFALAEDPEAAKRDALLRHPVGRFGQGSDIAAMAVWLASDEAAFATGQVFVVDGGLTASSPLQPGLF